ncbi:hypothetical protein AX17_005092 [Amanita inopinata Kibby_2008]|nr:hypothetical protein AX17_005092 [Amanita inopinata Kibby_2008]
MQSLHEAFDVLSLSDNHSRSRSSTISSPLSIPRSLTPHDSEDEVVWSLSESSISFSAISEAGSSAFPQPGSDHAEDGGDGDDDFVLLSGPRCIRAIRRWSDLISESGSSNGECHEPDMREGPRGSDIVQPLARTSLSLGSSASNAALVSNQNERVKVGSPDTSVSGKTTEKHKKAVQGKEVDVQRTPSTKGRRISTRRAEAAPPTPTAREAPAAPVAASKGAHNMVRSKKGSKGKVSLEATLSPPTIKVPGHATVPPPKSASSAQVVASTGTVCRAERVKEQTVQDKKKERRRGANKSKRENKQRKKQAKTPAPASASGAANAQSNPSNAASDKIKPIATADTAPEIFNEASVYISSFLANPMAQRDKVCRLTLLQSLIVELGLASTALPKTLTAARAFLKSRAFLNIREYLATRGQGQAAIQGLLHPSRSALIRDIKRKGNPASLKWVKKQGLNVLLVTCYH